MPTPPDTPPGSNLPQSYGPRKGPQSELPAPRPAALPQFPWAQQPGAQFHEEEEEGFAIQRYLDILLNRKWVVLAVAATVVLLTAVQVFTTTPLYRATATVQIDPEGQSVLPYEDIQLTGAIRGSFDYIATES